jgi:hypothetical protein
MIWDVFFTRLINGLAGKHTWADWLFLTLSDPDMLWLPGILLGSYWLWRSPREALIGGPILGLSIGILDFMGA